ncbi:MAG: cbb3-type cytochrome oxidase assembly protein CcoS [Rhodospirillaceae bacterium]|jgi:cbb3-type cytochrome oxidase maturation protein|nr:cbb3-type cytochrome oxidase assembly protein CcoS [Rhodospirillaceae bacterium]MBT5242776.1 cbb3-type cytochrome oxidase assembly protein CcoS [Rhodospirillaceae bacterium]MBT5562747.1 cbb3-type cytochrome oxidase assembly protein CcoS [Rhodospirillaceae bacterium]MBT6243252.1 cbb3-type cytochrome oxidase assembly protein CcoS [Rhodospirillaceae bacterium]
MDILLYLIPIALLLGSIALAAFLWSLKSGQFEDMEGAANRILFDDEDTSQQLLANSEKSPAEKDLKVQHKASTPD